MRTQYDLARLQQEIPYTANGKIDYDRLNDWFTPHHVMYEGQATRLLGFEFGNGEVKLSHLLDSPRSEAVLVIPPWAGHTSQIADYDLGQSIIQSALLYSKHDVYCIDWVSSTPERADESYSDLIMEINRAVRAIDKPVHLVGLCMGGTVATIYSALFPENIASLTVAGAPIDLTDMTDCVLKQAVDNPLEYFEMAVGTHRGLMSGELMLQCWMSSNMVQHYVNRYTDPLTYRKARFDAWYYENVSDLSGAWYLWLVENHFKANKLPKGELVVCGTPVDLRQITCPVNLVTGTKDNISTPVQTNNLAKYVNASRVTKYEGESGHIGVFMSKRMIADVWNQMFEFM